MFNVEYLFDLRTTTFFEQFPSIVAIGSRWYVGADIKYQLVFMCASLKSGEFAHVTEKGCLYRHRYKQGGWTLYSRSGSIDMSLAVSWRRLLDTRLKKTRPVVRLVFLSKFSHHIGSHPRHPSSSGENLMTFLVGARAPGGHWVIFSTNRLSNVQV